MLLEELELYAKNNNIPIMQKDGIAFLVKYIKEHQIKRVLEIGSAIGYSAIKMALVGKDIHIKTIERDFERYELAVENIKKFNLEDQIEIINIDAFDLEEKETYDLIFIDAAKSQSIKFFEKFKTNLQQNGTIITDNINFHGLTHATEIKNRNTRQLVGKIRSYIEFLKNNQEFTTVFIDDGDGIAISTRNA
ncbi:MAG: O-methyltransferase [Bacilli bacterium]|nr:O-methyltransferase [Bacilli bacterium]